MPANQALAQISHPTQEVFALSDKGDRAQPKNTRLKYNNDDDRTVRTASLSRNLSENLWALPNTNIRNEILLYLHMNGRDHGLDNPHDDGETPSLMQHNTSQANQRAEKKKRWWRYYINAMNEHAIMILNVLEKAFEGLLSKKEIKQLDEHIDELIEDLNIAQSLKSRFGRAANDSGHIEQIKENLEEAREDLNDIKQNPSSFTKTAVLGTVAAFMAVRRHAKAHTEAMKTGQKFETREPSTPTSTAHFYTSSAEPKKPPARKPWTTASFYTSEFFSATNNNRTAGKKAKNKAEKKTIIDNAAPSAKANNSPSSDDDSAEDHQEPSSP